MSTADAITLKKALEKADSENSHSNVKDILQALNDFPGMNEQILKETKLGKALQNIKVKYDQEAPEIGKFITNILKAWTRIAKKGKSGSSAELVTAAAPSSQPTVEPATLPTTVSAPTPTAPLSGTASVPSRIPAPVPVAASLPAQRGVITPQRQKIVDLLEKTLSIPIAQPKFEPSHQAVQKLAIAIESSCWEAFPCDKDGKQTDYTAKIRTLTFNLKKNDNLRPKIFSGAISVARLLTMTTADLASNHILEMRAREAAEDEESRRQDWLETHKAVIISNAAASVGGAIAQPQEGLEVFDFENEPEEVSDDD